MVTQHLIRERMAGTHEIQRKNRGTADHEPPRVADHPALDMLNTIFRTEDGLVEGWQSDADVAAWLAVTGFAGRDATKLLKAGDLLREARRLREIVRTMVHDRKAGKRMVAGALNAFLSESRSHLMLTSASRGSFQVTRVYDGSKASGALAPLAESCAELLATGDFSLIRACEGLGCVLWFYDRTKGHRRRWCSMATCGNRHKVAKHRSSL